MYGQDWPYLSKIFYRFFFFSRIPHAENQNEEPISFTVNITLQLDLKAFLMKTWETEFGVNNWISISILILKYLQKKLMIKYFNSKKMRC